MYKLFLDDVRPPPDIDWITVNSYKEFVNKITKDGLPYFVSFDHDLADEHYPWNQPDQSKPTIDYSIYKEKTGYDCAKWLLQYCRDKKITTTTMDSTFKERCRETKYNSIT